jgi:Predicted nucleotide-binding protein containing TIR-like domain
MNDKTSIEKPELVVFSSGKVAQSGVTDAIRDELFARGFSVTPWKEGFFPANEQALRAFLKKLLCFDAAVLVLGDDDIRLGPADGANKQHVPRDNVIFELGACMSRLGTKKTFIVRPDAPEIVLPSYFHGAGYDLKYEARRVDRNWRAAVGSACAEIANAFANFDRSAFFSDLPASGLAHGYFHNFVLPTYNAFNSGNLALKVAAEGAAARRKPRPTPAEGLGWSKPLGFKLSIVIPEKPLNRDQVQHLFTGGPDQFAPMVEGRSKRRLQFTRLQVLLQDGRNIAIYTEHRKGKSDPFRIFDVPTTLLTSQEVIGRVDAFWGAGDLGFRDSLTHREALSFSRTLATMIGDKAGSIKTVSMAEFSKEAFAEA